MAKWGEGDSRWIVEDREDGKNVGAWHWEERNMRDWAEKRLQQMISEGAPRTSAGDCTVVLASLKELKGDCHLHTRKGTFSSGASRHHLAPRFSPVVHTTPEIYMRSQLQSWDNAALFHSLHCCTHSLCRLERIHTSL